MILFFIDLRNLGATKPVPPVPGTGVVPVRPVGSTYCIDPDGRNTCINPPFPMDFRLVVDVTKDPLSHSMMGQHSPLRLTSWHPFGILLYFGHLQKFFTLDMRIKLVYI